MSCTLEILPFVSKLVLDNSSTIIFYKEGPDLFKFFEVIFGCYTHLQARLDSSTIRLTLFLFFYIIHYNIY